jgi:Tfp pilus assembly protein FimT
MHKEFGGFTWGQYTPLCCSGGLRRHRPLKQTFISAREILGRIVPPVFQEAVLLCRYPKGDKLRSHAAGKNACTSQRCIMTPGAGVTLIEAMIAVTVAAVILSIALPAANDAIKAYRLNADASDLAGMLNVTRIRAASQYAPYRLDIDTAHGTYVVEKLCGSTASSGPGSDPNCAGAYPAYQPFSNPLYEMGTQYASGGDRFSSCRPASVGSYPDTITADAAGCASLLQIYFNTRGAPVDQTGSPLSNGGAVVYATNQNEMIEGVTVSPGGRVATWFWNVSSNQWTLR